MQKILSIYICFILSLGLYATNRIVDQVLWVVGDEPILQSDIENEIARRRYEKESIDGDAYCVIPEQIAIQKLFIAQAKLDSIVVPEGSVDQQVDARIKYFIGQIGSKEKLEEYFKKPLKDIRETMSSSVRDQLMAQEMQRNIMSGIHITPADVRRFYNEIPKDSIPTIPEQVEVQIISISPQVTLAEQERVKSQLRDFREKIENGEYEFSTLAILYSEDRGSALQGGELGFMTRGKLVPEFANTAFALYDPKKVSRIVESEFGYHIIQLIERKNDQVNCRHILLTPKIGYAERIKTSTQLDSIATCIRNEESSFAENALRFSEDELSKQTGGVMINMQNGTTKFQLQELPSEIAKAIYGMEVGEISKPFPYKDEKNKERIAIVKLKSRTKAHKAHPDTDYQLLKDMVTGLKNQEEIKKWILKKQAETYIYITPEHRNCTFQFPNWVK
ncbi:MAG: peptidylprolyl isomerase [Paludibacteraceae bacterium]|jgi:peptidyl-prolyl cis-trans isomerase SurA|nr:peptidylprolyl isomerase [Paludibacteraceae bacterium]MEE1174252.1 peptidylprolyl isomerase [Paludibacteraceae bacterium]